jgi:hypothetical protein
VATFVQSSAAVSAVARMALAFIATFVPAQVGHATPTRDFRRPPLAQHLCPVTPQPVVPLPPLVIVHALSSPAPGPRVPMPPPEPTGWAYLRKHPLQAQPWSLRAIVAADLDQRDCIGNLCGPQSITLRLGMLDQTVPPSPYPPLIGGLGAAAGALALQLKPGPPIEPNAGPNRDGWTDPPKGLWPAGPPYAFSPIINATNREGGLKFVANW